MRVNVKYWSKGGRFSALLRVDIGILVLEAPKAHIFRGS